MDEDPKVKEAEEYNEAGNCAFKDKEYEKAIRFYDYAIELFPKEPRYYSNRSAAYLGAGDRSRALADAEKTVDLSPTWAKGYSRKASVFLRLKKYKDCIETCKIGK
ncbi:uncharacterized protein [Blastocystis hominis]|uniref:Uncharacterized protein n=1 Tax=Blastocystis hominis TaxID=12968 RepID=D8M6R4_BLAHO|nr:uncharacterized protein [Blastocystis hominis]CBK23482.2 unnamed protein product [Blastocystis hominis]|eukprot:XP_012897530.1 uncharacterized protein [Blastocystis hominis]